MKKMTTEKTLLPAMVGDDRRWRRGESYAVTPQAKAAQPSPRLYILRMAADGPQSLNLISPEENLIASLESVGASRVPPPSPLQIEKKQHSAALVTGRRVLKKGH